MVGDRHRLAVAALLVLSATLAVHSLVQDSATFDETDHLVAGFSYLATDDFRLAPDHPPLARVWAALPAWLSGVAFHPEPDAWRRGDFWAVGREWLYVQNDPDALLVPARLMMVVLLLALDVAIYAAARTAFGRAAGLLALFAAALDPGLLAHGRLVTTDVPICLALLAGVLLLARALGHGGMRRNVACVMAWALLPLTKMSWPLVLPAAAAMLGFFLAVGGRRGAGGRLRRAVCLAAAIAAASYAALWVAYGGRYSGFRGEDPGATYLSPSGVPARDMEGIWRQVLSDEDGRPKPGWLLSLVRLARERRLLPEPYLYGLAYTVEAMGRRTSYFHGEHSTAGPALYYPMLLVTKTPLPLLVLMLAGLARLGAEWRRAGREGRLLLVGLAPLAATVLLSAIATPMAIGHRHLLPLEPPLLVLAGAAAAWARTGRALVRGGLALVAAGVLGVTLGAHPHYLGYFNATIGGSSGAHAWFADSNLDWGQDLKRLASYQRGRPDEPFYLAYFGSALPAAYGVRAQAFASYLPLGEPAAFGPGTYVVSLNQLLGVYQPLARDDFWAQPETRADYRALIEQAAGGEPPDQFQRLLLVRARGGRLLQQLMRREPDARIGSSLVVHRIDAAELARLTAPPE